MAGFFSDAWDYIKMTGWDQPASIVKDVSQGDIGGAFDDWKHTFGDNERAESGMFHDVGINGWVGDHPEETAGAVVGTIFGGIYAAGAYGATAAAGSAGTAAGTSAAGVSTTAGTSALGASTAASGASGAASGAAPISAATGTLTPAGEAMGGQAAVDANMAAGASSESAWGNFFHGFTGSNITGSTSDSAEYAQALRGIMQNQQKDQTAQQQRQQEFMNSDDRVRSFLPKISAGQVQAEDPMLKSQVKPAQMSGGPFTGALNNIQQTFQS